MTTIFFVEDDTVVIQVYRAKLLREGFAVEVAEDGLVAVKMLAAMKPERRRVGPDDAQTQRG